MNKKKLRKGYFEVIHAPSMPLGPFDQAELLRAAEAAVLRNPGWPIGIAMSEGEHRPRPTSDGVSSKVISGEFDTVDYWFLRNDGAFYFARTFEEDTNFYKEHRLMGVDVKVLAFDTRTREVAEAFLHATALYRALRAEGDVPILFRVSHVGLKDRVVTATETVRAMRLGHHRTCQENEVSWEREIPLSNVNPTIKDLTFEVVSELFVLFDFKWFERSTIDGIVDQFHSASSEPHS